MAIKIIYMTPGVYFQSNLFNAAVDLMHCDTNKNFLLIQEYEFKNNSSLKIDCKNWLIGTNLYLLKVLF